MFHSHRTSWNCLKAFRPVPSLIRATSSGAAMAIRKVPSPIGSEVMSSFQVGGHQNGGWRAKKVPPSHVPGHVRGRDAARRSTYRSGLAVARPCIGEDYREELLSFRRGAPGSVAGKRPQCLEGRLWPWAAEYTTFFCLGEQAGRMAGDSIKQESEGHCLRSRSNPFRQDG